MSPRRKGTHCIRGHEYTKANARVDPNGYRHCKICEKAKYLERKSRQESYNPRRYPSDLSGLRFTRWTVVRLLGKDDHRHQLYECVCDCGNLGRVTRPNLVGAASHSCGCRRLERITAANFKHGRNGDDPTYGTWSSMHARCSKTNLKYIRWYAEHGIKVCDEWSDFNQFLKDMGERPKGKTLDRIDPYGDYEPSNCRWATPKEQRHNQRCTCPLSSVLRRLPELLANLPNLTRCIGPQPVVKLLDSPMDDEIA